MSSQRPYLNNILRSRETIPDSELIVNGHKEIPADHWCRGCEWATNLMDRFMCPFIDGSCAKIPMSIKHPDPQFFREELQNHNAVKAIRTKK